MHNWHMGRACTPPGLLSLRLTPAPSTTPTTLDPSFEIEAESKIKRTPNATLTPKPTLALATASAVIAMWSRRSKASIGVY